MTKPQMHNEIAKLEEVQISFCDSPSVYHLISELIIDYKRQIYADQPVALKMLGL